MFGDGAGLAPPRGGVDLGKVGAEEGCEALAETGNVDCRFDASFPGEVGVPDLEEGDEALAEGWRKRGGFGFKAAGEGVMEGFFVGAAVGGFHGVGVGAALGLGIGGGGDGESNGDGAAGGGVHESAGQEEGRGGEGGAGEIEGPIGDAAGVMDGDPFTGAAVDDEEAEASVEEGVTIAGGGNAAGIEGHVGRLKEGHVWGEGDGGAGGLCGAEIEEGVAKEAVAGGDGEEAVAVNGFDGEAAGDGMDNAKADAVGTGGDDFGAVGFPTEEVTGEGGFEEGSGLAVGVDGGVGEAGAVVGDGDLVVGVEGDPDFRVVVRSELVEGVDEEFHDEHVEAAVASVADEHGGAFADAGAEFEPTGGNREADDAGVDLCARTGSGGIVHGRLRWLRDEAISKAPLEVKAMSVFYYELLENRGKMAESDLHISLSHQGL